MVSFRFLIDVIIREMESAEPADLFAAKTPTVIFHRWLDPATLGWCNHTIFERTLLPLEYQLLLST